MRQRLNSSQQSQIEQIAQERGARCPCGSGDLHSGDTARLYVGGNATVDLYCLREDTHPGVEGAYQIFDLSHEEAKQVGIGTHHRDVPETSD